MTVLQNLLPILELNQSWGIWSFLQNTKLFYSSFFAFIFAIKKHKKLIMTSKKLRIKFLLSKSLQILSKDVFWQTPSYEKKIFQNFDHVSKWKCFIFASFCWHQNLENLSFNGFFAEKGVWMKMTKIKVNFFSLTKACWNF